MSADDRRALAHAERWTFNLTRRFVLAVLGRIEFGRLVVQTPAGDRIERVGPSPGPDAVVVLKSWRAVRRTILGGPLGFAQGYLDEEWTSPDLPSLIELLARNSEASSAAAGSSIGRGFSRVWHRVHENTRLGSRRNIEFHYDLGNAFFKAWLDRGMQYSSAIYDGASDLEGAQSRKLDVVTDRLDLSGGERVLEIGCGWGAVAERLAGAHGCHVTGLTLSHEQLAEARDRLARAGLADRASFRLQDYRDCGDTFDRVVSIEMIEAVGEKYWPRYFDLLRERLARGGTAVIQAITIQEDRFDDYRRQTDFIQRYIFPGGMLPTISIMRGEIARAGLNLVELQRFGDSYAATLAEWRRRFDAAWPQIEPLGFDDRFRRMWTYYLGYCEGGFRAGAIDVGLYVIKG